MSKNLKSKPTYESIRYDIRPPAGLSDVESDYLINIVGMLENHPNCAEVGLAFELSTAQYPPRSTSKHAHIFTRWKTPIRSDKMPILQMAKYSKSRKWPNVAVRSMCTVNWSPASYWSAGYIQKEASHIGNMKNYVDFWWEHERLLSCKKVRLPRLDNKNDLDELVNYWFSSYEKIRLDHQKWLEYKIAGVFAAIPPLDIRHVFAHYVITHKCNLATVKHWKTRYNLAMCTYRDYRKLIEISTAWHVVVLVAAEDSSTGYDEKDVEPMNYRTMDEVWPILIDTL